MKPIEIITKIKDTLHHIIRKIFIPKLYVEGKEFQKSYCFERKFFGLYVIFLLYSLLLLFGINFPGSYLDILTFGNPFVFCDALIVLFLALSLLYSIDKFRVFIFEKYTAIKQIVLYIVMITIIYLILLFINSINMNFISYLLALSTMWLVLLSVRFYMYSRKFATKIEARLITKYSAFRGFLAFIAPYFILGVLVLISLFFRGLLVFISLDFLAPFAPAEAVSVYELEMRLIMPLIYFSLILTLLFIIFEYVFTRRRAETRRAGLFDNYTFSLIVLFIFFFQVFQLTMFLVLNPATVTALKSTVGETSMTIWIIIIIEFAFSMYFLYRIIKKLGRSLEWSFLIFKKDGLILLILGCVFAQTLTRFALQTQVPNQEITLIGQFFMADKYIVSLLMIIFLGSTLLFYYLKPHETSMFMRLQKETVDQDIKSRDIIYQLIRSEYIRRARAFPLEILDRELIRTTKLPKNKIYSLVENLAEIDMDILLTEKKDDNGTMVKMIDFTSVTESYDKKGIAQKKAKKYLSERLYTTMTKKKGTHLNLGAIKSNDKASDQFLTSLSTDYDKKQKEEMLLGKKQKETTISFTKKEIPISLKNLIIDLLKKEYTYRIENEEKYPDFHFSISEIASQVQMVTRISPGELYPILENINESDLELSLIQNPKEPEDKQVSFFPVADDDLSYSLANFRPEEYKKVRIKVIKNYMKFLKRKKTKAIFSKLRKEIGNKTEEQQVWNTLYKILNNHYPLYVAGVERVRLGEDLPKVIKIFPKKDIVVFGIESKAK